MAIAPDVDGDGLDDLIVGAYYANSSSGGAYLVSGPATGGGSLSTADADFVGVSTYSYAGCSVDGVGDMNGDGYGDVIIGAYGTNSYSGTAYILHGPLTGSYNLNSSDGRYNGERSSDYAGYAVSRAGDVNGDGYADALVGAYYNDDGGSSSGAAYLLFGPATGAGASLLTADAKYTGENTSDYAGRSLDTAGDVNGDGLDDILIGAYYADGVRASYTGAAYLIYGPGTGISSLRDRDAKMEGEQSYDYAGQGVSQAGDVNDDGYDDVLVGAYYADTSSALYSTGVAYLMYGPISGDYRLGVDSDAEFQGEVSYDYAGFNVSQAGDLDNDGYDDVVIGAYYNEVDPSIYGSGSSYVVYGPVSGSMGLASADGKLYGTGTYDYVGFSNGGGGDLDGDGYDDMVVGGYGADTGGSYSGSAYVFLGGMGY